jgi:hypothetical protein
MAPRRSKQSPASSGSRRGGPKTGQPATRRRARAPETAALSLPPLPIDYSDLKAGSASVADEMPRFLTDFTDLLGIRAPTFGKRIRDQLRKALHKSFIDLRGYSLAQMILDGKIGRANALYAITEAQLRYSQPQFRRSRSKNAIALLMLNLDKQAARPAGCLSLPGYIEARDAIDACAERTASSVRFDHFLHQLANWAETTAARNVHHFGARFQKTWRLYRWWPPKRITPGMISSLTREYRDWAVLFEQLLVKMVGGAAALRGEQVNWRRLQTRRFVDLEEDVGRELQLPELAHLLAGVDRHVRNALAHGHPTIDTKAKRITLHNGGRVIREWSADEFYVETKRASAYVLAMLQFDAALNARRFRDQMERLVQAVRAETAKT